MLKLFLCATLLSTCSIAVAQNQPAAQAQPPAQQANAGKAKSHDRVICQDQGEIGSRLSIQRVCLTAEQWKEQQQAAQDTVAHAQQATSH